MYSFPPGASSRCSGLSRMKNFATFMTFPWVASQ